MQFKYGDFVQINDAKNNHWTTKLVEGEKTYTHKGYVEHSKIVEVCPGSIISSHLGYKVSVFRPSTNDFTLSMDRGPTIIYPKDAAAIVSELDIRPDSNILESGIGSAGLSIQILKLLSTGTLTSVEINELFGKIAKQNIIDYFKEDKENHNLIIEDILKFNTDIKFDAIVLDLLKPWEVIEKAWELLKPGKPLVCYITTTTQLSLLDTAIKEFDKFETPESYEITKRVWHLDGLSVRPSHKESGFSGFILKTRRLNDGHTRLIKTTKLKIAEDKKGWESINRDISERKVKKLVKKSQNLPNFEKND